MENETFKQQLRKKILDLKPETAGFYTELYNLVAVMVKLNPDALDAETTELLNKKIGALYSMPDKKHTAGLSELERIYFRFQNEENVRIKSKVKINLSDIKAILDRTRRDLLFWLALVEDKPRDYGIVLKNEAREGTDA